MWRLASDFCGRSEEVQDCLVCSCLLRHGRAVQRRFQSLVFDEALEQDAAAAARAAHCCSICGWLGVLFLQVV